MGGPRDDGGPGPGAAGGALASLAETEARPGHGHDGDGGTGREAIDRFIKVEANLLRLPLFALHTKGLRTLDAIECRGHLNRGDVAHEFRFRACRSTATHYPGPLSRSVHLAFLSLLTERGGPARNPLSWTWRDLCRRMRVSCSGRTVERLKGAIKATAGLYIESHHALYSRPADRRIHTREEGLHLYDRFCFLGTDLPDGGQADTNSLWLSDWYLANLNALFTAPLDYTLWRDLEDRSPIASRLYEFLLLNLYNGLPSLRINYDNLARFLPVKPERHPSQARQQFGPALGLLAAAGVLSGTDWTESRDGRPQLVLHRGPRLPARGGKGESAASADADADLSAAVDLPGPVPSDDERPPRVEVEEVHAAHPPEWTLVADFHRQWSGRPPSRPGRKELETARALLRDHGLETLQALIPLAVKRMRTRWPEARTFGGVVAYLPDAAAELERDRQRQEADEAARQHRQRLRDEAGRQDAEQARLAATWGPAWEALAPPQRDAVRRAVLARGPYLAHAPRLLEGLCLEELARQHGEPPV